MFSPSSFSSIFIVSIHRHLLSLSWSKFSSSLPIGLSLRIDTNGLESVIRATCFICRGITGIHEGCFAEILNIICPVLAVFVIWLAHFHASFFVAIRIRRCSRRWRFVIFNFAIFYFAVKEILGETVSCSGDSNSVDPYALPDPMSRIAFRLISAVGGSGRYSSLLTFSMFPSTSLSSPFWTDALASAKR